MNNNEGASSNSGVKHNIDGKELVIASTRGRKRDKLKSAKHKRRKSSTSSDTEADRERKKLKKQIRKEKKHAKKLKKAIEKEKTRKKSHTKEEELADVPIQLMERSKAMAPITKEEWDKKQSIIRRSFDEETGRYRLIKGDGEIIEEIVSRDRHIEINRQATLGDGAYFQNRLSQIKKT